MITETNQNAVAVAIDGESANGTLRDFKGLSTDAKPVLEPKDNGSEFYEMDTGDSYIFDGENRIWHKKKEDDGAGAVNAQPDITAFNAHPDNKNNPHGVTAAQAGAVPAGLRTVGLSGEIIGGVSTDLSGNVSIPAVRRGTGVIVGNGATKTYVNLFTLPASTGGTYDMVEMQGVFGAWEGRTGGTVWINARNRNTLTVNSIINGSPSLGTGNDSADIFAMKNAGDSITFYAEYQRYTVIQLYYNTVIGPVTINNTSSATAPTGTEVWRLSTANSRVVRSEYLSTLRSDAQAQLDNINVNMADKNWVTQYITSALSAAGIQLTAFQQHIALENTERIFSEQFIQSGMDSFMAGEEVIDK